MHVVPRATLFNPELGNTMRKSLKQSLLGQLSGKCITEFVPCLAKGVIAHLLVPILELWRLRNREKKLLDF